MRVPCDAGADDDGRRALEPLVGEIDRLDSLDAFQLVDGQGMAVDTVAAERRVTWPNVAPPAKYATTSATYLSETSDLGSPLASATAPFAPMRFRSRLQQARKGRSATSCAVLWQSPMPRSCQPIARARAKFGQACFQASTSNSVLRHSLQSEDLERRKELCEDVDHGAKLPSTEIQRCVVTKSLN